MRTKELEKQLGLTKHTLHFYEKEGFIHPLRDENGYRNYSEVDVQTLQMVKFLRSLSISLDDIKLILEGKVSFQEVLQVNQEHLDKQVDSLAEIQASVTKYKEMNIPLIPVLSEIDGNEAIQGIFGFQKGSKRVCLGRVLDRPLAFRKLFLALGLELFLCGFVFFLMNELHVAKERSMVAVVMLFGLFAVLMLGSNFTFCDLANGQSMEFLEEGVRFYKNTGRIQTLRYFGAVLIGNEAKYRKQYKYEDIESVEVRVQKRYMRVSSFALPLEVFVPDYTFEFKDGERLSLVGALTLEEDGRYVAAILREKVSNLIDEQNILYALAKGIDLKEYIKK